MIKKHYDCVQNFVEQYDSWQQVQEEVGEADNLPAFIIVEGYLYLDRQLVVAQRKGAKK